MGRRPGPRRPPPPLPPAPPPPPPSLPPFPRPCARVALAGWWLFSLEPTPVVSAHFVLMLGGDAAPLAAAFPGASWSSVETTGGWNARALESRGPGSPPRWPARPAHTLLGSQALPCSAADAPSRRIVPRKRAPRENVYLETQFSNELAGFVHLVRRNESSHSEVFSGPGDARGSSQVVSSYHAFRRNPLERTHVQVNPLPQARETFLHGALSLCCEDLVLLFFNSNL